MHTGPEVLVIWARFAPPKVRILLILGLVLFAFMIGLAVYVTLLSFGLAGRPFTPHPYGEVILMIPSISLTSLVLLVGIALGPAAGRPRAIILAFLAFEGAGLVLTLVARAYFILLNPRTRPRCSTWSTSSILSQVSARRWERSSSC